MRKIKVYILGFIIIGLAILIYKGMGFYKLKINYSKIDSKLLGRLTEIYHIENGEYPKKIAIFKEFLKNRNSELYYQITKVNFNLYNNDENGFGYYINGYDGENDSLTSSYNIYEVDFISSFNVSGDIIVPIEKGLDFDNNMIYKVHGDKLKEISSISISDLYNFFLGCEKIRTKFIGIDKKDYSFSVLNNNHTTLFSSISDTSRVVLNKYLIGNNELFKKNDSVYFINISTFNLEDIECFDN